MSEGYNGWTNYETWNLALWLDNGFASYAEWSERAQTLYDNTDSDDTAEDRIDEATAALAKEIQSDVEENTPEVTGFYADILNAAINQVNWIEIAEHYIADVDKDSE